MWSSQVHQRLILCTRRSLSSTAAVRSSNHYDVLGITPKATQAEVKAAYYKLSKLHHPDTSSTDDEDSRKFRLITEAYEILGNYRTRQLYDKGLYGHDGSTPRRKDVTPDHPNIAFYRSRFDKERVPSSQTKGIYNFDEWTRQHYSESFAKTNIKHKPKWESHKLAKEVYYDEGALKFLSVGLLMLIALGFSVMSIGTLHFDNPRPSSDNRDKPV